MRTQEAFLTLIQELNGDISEIERLKATNTRAWGRIEAGSEDVLDALPGVHLEFSNKLTEIANSL